MKITGWDIVRGTWQLQHAIFAAAHEQLEAIGLNPKALSILGILEYLDRPTLIAQSIGSPLPTVSNLLKDLEGRGYVQRVHGQQDRRQVTYRRTDLGTDALCRGIDAVNLGAADYVQRLDPEELQVLAGLLERLTLPRNPG